MAVYAGKKVKEVGKVFAGTTNESRKELDSLLSAGEQPVAAVEYLYATDDDQLFQPVFRGLRDDKEPADCVLSQLVKTNREVAEEKPAAAKAAKPKKKARG
jgi:ATP-dependent DNA ligase